MHFRVRGNNVQLVKTVAGEEGKKAQSRPVGSANIATGALNPAAQAALTPAEVAEVQAWVARHKTQVEQRNQLEFATTADRLTELAGWIRSADEALVTAHADEVLESLRALRTAILRKRPNAKA
jgi:hypothetical protein